MESLKPGGDASMRDTQSHPWAEWKRMWPRRKNHSGFICNLGAFLALRSKKKWVWFMCVSPPSYTHRPDMSFRTKQFRCCQCQNSGEADKVFWDQVENKHVQCFGQYNTLKKKLLLACLLPQCLIGNKKLYQILFNGPNTWLPSMIWSYLCLMKQA